MNRSYLLACSKIALAYFTELIATQFIALSDSLQSGELANIP